MLGFVIGTLCLFGLIRVLRRGRFGYGYPGWGEGPYFHRFHHFNRFHRFGGTRGRRMRGRGALK